MKVFPENIKFKYSWRKYQQRVLDGLDQHLKNNHLHVIAPPGSGKTVLGIEVAIRINQPTLILAPTIAIRNQWIQKLCDLFLQTGMVPDWVSRDIRHPEFLTIVTYQGLHAACNDLKVEESETDIEEEITENEIGDSSNYNLENIIAGLKEKQIKTIVVDEAHHLKNEWWQTLIKIKNSIKPVIIGLTATPPYDVTPNEWQRYLELNGPIDVEISVPELIIEGDLCPHQDYVYLSHPTENEFQQIAQFREGIELLFEEIKNDETLSRAIESHPAWINPGENLEWIYNNLSSYSACLIFLNTMGRIIPETQIEIIGDATIEIPDFDYSWAEILLAFYLLKEKTHFRAFEEHQKNIENKLRRFGAIDKRQISFSQNKRITSALTSSISKLNSIKQIVDFEHQQLGQTLRLVILTDFIRNEFYADKLENTFELNKIGVITIFEKLRRENSDAIKIGVLTGSVVIIPQTAFNLFHERAEHCGLSNIKHTPVPFDGDYILIEECEQLKNDIVNMITEVFQQGEIQVLIGTKSLLGEGWDAPAINSLILASFVGSFVLSNQMRGRAIRTQNGNLNKTGNIWHLCCIDPTSATGGEDFDMLKRRFKSFVGISVKDDFVIENGIGRLNISGGLQRKENIASKNAETIQYAGNRQALKDYWRKALENGVNLTEEIKIPFGENREYRAAKSLYLNKTIANLLTALGFGFLEYVFEMLQSLSKNARYMKTLDDLYIYLTIFVVIGILIFGRLAFKAFRLYIKYRDISKDIQQIGNALLYTMINAKVIRTNPQELNVEASVDDYGSVYCHLDGGTAFERSAFIGMLQEIIEPIDNPRYVIIRKNLLMYFIKQRDFHSVPEIIGRNKTLALYFEQEWANHVGPCELIFTRTIEGRQLLLKSRIKSLASQLDNNAERISKWK
ncbi:DEAD/DEAH box helicase family protein [Mucilaginibacter paludis]|uniref:Type III restriction protein res subunit n=1 Tax=Mucilaginibacter paludis DSM 18603 TaxID=714943 RepID=H1Y4J1_9SPHI|nr:DEAD/DEAH box helicase family protein [Mucilaginibacter paludis]EHQ26775.1 type III restriction protein res subunit [Mucilaginibacter paludis DSM 18603]